MSKITKKLLIIPLFSIKYYDYFSLYLSFRITSHIWFKNDLYLPFCYFYF